MTDISSKDNPHIKLYQKLSSAKKYRKENGMFVLEGVRLITDAVSENAVLHCVFITKTCLAKHGDALNFLDGLDSDRIFIITDELGNKMSDTDGSQGMFAICKTLDNVQISDTIKKGGKYLLLHNVQDPGNMGTIIRTADAVGINAVVAVGCCDIYNPKVIRSTMGSLFRMKIIDTDIDTAFECFENAEINTFAAVIDSDAVSLTDCSFNGGAAAFIGNEGNGLPSEIAERCSTKLTIKMQGTVNSLNAAMAAGIIMWELMK